ncbi:MAG: cytochrome c3 family protein [Deltaproteobacteria bacterium]|nr:cytochrome c3 family protein [Deltaproteobacteria bacterium]
MKKRSLLTSAISLLGVVFVFSMVHATATDPADTMTMNSKVYKKHKKVLVTFTHKKHNVDYKIACADCHHVYKDGKNVWKPKM